MTSEQIAQKKQQLQQLAEEVKVITKELAETGAVEMSEDELSGVAGGLTWRQFLERLVPFM